jgi:hypothetical protein
MKKPWRSIWFMSLTALLFFGAAFVTLRAAGQAAERSPITAIAPAAVASLATAPAASPAAAPAVSPAAANALAPSSARLAAPAPPSHQPPAPPSHPPPSAPEESATIADDPTTAPNAAQSADNNVSFPTDI